MWWESLMYNRITNLNIYHKISSYSLRDSLIQCTYYVSEEMQRKEYPPREVAWFMKQNSKGRHTLWKTSFDGREIVKIRQ